MPRNKKQSYAQKDELPCSSSSDDEMVYVDGPPKKFTRSIQRTHYEIDARWIEFINLFKPEFETQLNNRLSSCSKQVLSSNLSTTILKNQLISDHVDHWASSDEYAKKQLGAIGPLLIDDQLDFNIIIESIPMEREDCLKFFFQCCHHIDVSSWRFLLKWLKHHDITSRIFWLEMYQKYKANVDIDQSIDTNRLSKQLLCMHYRAKDLNDVAKSLNDLQLSISWCDVLISTPMAYHSRILTVLKEFGASINQYPFSTCFLVYDLMVYEDLNTESLKVMFTYLGDQKNAHDRWNLVSQNQEVFIHAKMYNVFKYTDDFVKNNNLMLKADDYINISNFFNLFGHNEEIFWHRLLEQLSFLSLDEFKEMLSHARGCLSDEDLKHRINWLLLLDRSNNVTLSEPYWYSMPAEWFSYLKDELFLCDMIKIMKLSSAYPKFYPLNKWDLHYLRHIQGQHIRSFSTILKPWRRYKPSHVSIVICLLLGVGGAYYSNAFRLVFTLSLFLTYFYTSTRKYVTIDNASIDSESSSVLKTPERKGVSLLSKVDHLDEFSLTPPPEYDSF
ncbi:MAG: hypothetical protein ACON5A_02110 [Candidatus Comchoanobacterales bacterium]